MADAILTRTIPSSFGSAGALLQLELPVELPDDCSHGRPL
jgi:hypothetical protein